MEYLSLLVLIFTLPRTGDLSSRDIALDRASPPAATVPAAQPGALTEAGRAVATIVISPQPSNEILFAAELLQSYAKKISGAVLPIATAREPVAGNRLVIGLPDLARAAGVSLSENLPEEGYLIATAGPDVFVLGGSDRGSLYGVCGLLEDLLGVRWYVADDPLGDYIPCQPNIRLQNVHVQQTPSFPMRWIGCGSDWSIKNRQNGSGQTLGAGFKIEPGIFHTQNLLMPHREYFEKHPEYFALIAGERSRNPQCKLCYSNPEVAREVACRMAKILEADPEIDLISFSPTDGKLWCECKSCQATDEEGVPDDQRMSRRSLLFYNSIAAELRKTHPEAKILIGAYNGYTWPPRDDTIKADPMLSVIIAHYEDYCMAHPVTDPACPPNRRYLQLISAWEKLGCGIYYYEYYRKGNWSDLPWPIVRSIRSDIPWYHRRGHHGVYTQFSSGDAWTLFPAYYVAAKLMWNVAADANAIVDEMCARLFGKAAPAMREYYRVMEDAMADCGRHFPGHGITNGRWIFTDAVLEEMGAALRNAHALDDDPLVKQRLAKFDLSYTYTRRLMELANTLDRASAPGAGLREELAAAEEALRIYQGLVSEVVGHPGRWQGIVNGKQALLRPFVRNRIDRLKIRLAELRARIMSPE